MFRHWGSIPGFLLSTWLVLVSGCGGESQPELPRTVPVSGKVVLNGEPLASAAVQFLSIGNTAGSDGRGTTDESGTYQLKQVGGATGVPPGEYKVVVSQLALAGGKPIQTGPDAPPPIEQGAMESLPAKYSSPVETTLTASVPAGGGTLDFELKTK